MAATWAGRLGSAAESIPLVAPGNGSRPSIGSPAQPGRTPNTGTPDNGTPSDYQTQTQGSQTQGSQTQGFRLTNGESQGANAHVPSIDQVQARRSVQWLASRALQRLPRHFAGDKDWGKTKRMWAGVKVRRDGFQLKTKRRYREVEHGRWIRYEVTLPEAADSRSIVATVHHVQPIDDPATGQQRWRIQSSLASPMRFTARIQRWNLGVRLFSATITGDLHVRFDSSANIGFVTDYTEVPPALQIDPHFDHAQLVLQRFEVNRISGLGGDVAEAWGEVLQEILVERFVTKQNQRLVQKLNSSIDKERDQLRVSLAKWLAL